MIYKVKVANLVTVYMGTSLKEAEETFYKSNLSATLEVQSDSGNSTVLRTKSDPKYTEVMKEAFSG